MSIEYFCSYHSYLESMEELNDAERGRLFTACLVYSKTGEVVELRGNERFLFPTFRSQIDRDKQNYEKRKEASRQNGAKGGRPKKPEVFEETQKTQGFLEKPKKPKEKEKEKEKEKKKAKKIYGEYANVLLTEEELQKLQAEFPSHWQKLIDRLSVYMQSKGVRYTDHLATMRNWGRKDNLNTQPGSVSTAPVMGSLEQEAIRRMLGREVE